MDLSKIHKDHRKAMQEVIAMRSYTNLTDEQISKLYKVYTELNKVPKKDWDKEETRRRVNESTGNINSQLEAGQA
jgi:hypothetical protein